MPKSLRHKSSRRREYSDTERESVVKVRKGEDGIDSGSSNRHLKDSASGDKRKLVSKSIDASKEILGLGNVEYTDGYGGGSGVVSLSKKRKEKVEVDRWTGGDTKEEQNLSKSEMKKEKEEGRGFGDSRRSSRREEIGYDVEEGKKSGSKSESRHHRSDRKERSDKEGTLDRERKGSKSERSERLVDIVSVSENVVSEGSKKHGGSGEERVGKHSVGNTEFNMQEGLRKLDPAKDNDRRVRSKRDDSGDGDRHLVGVRDPEDRRLSSRNEVAKNGKMKDDSHKDERNRGHIQEDVDKDIWHYDEKQLDNRPTRVHNGGRSDDKNLRNENKDLDVSQKRKKPHSSEYEREVDRDTKERDRDRDFDRDRGSNRDRDRGRHDYDRDREHAPARDGDLEHVNDRGREYVRDRDYARDRYRRDRDRVNDRDNEGGRDRDFDRDHDYASHVDEKGSRYKDDRVQQRSPDVYDGYHHGKKVRRTNIEVDKDRSLSHKPNVDGVASSSRRWASPTSRGYVGADKYRNGTEEETKHVDSLRDSTMSEGLDKLPKYRAGERRSKFDENHTVEFSERSPNTRASPAGLKERSPSSSCFDRSRFPSRASRRRSLEMDEAERRSSGSNDLRDISTAEDRQSREFSARKSMGDDYPSSDPSMYQKSGPGNVSSHGPGPSVFRSGADSPSFVGSFGEDSRGHSGSRYRRSVDPNVGRGPVNSWKGIPNWPSSLPNGFMPFPPGPPGPHHGGFPPIMSQFPPLFGVRPSLDMNHPGLPYHMAEGDRFPGHGRPLGWPNMVDGSVPPHFHLWDGSNGMFREDPGMFGHGHLGNAQRRDMNADIWKQSSDVNADVTSGSQKDGHTTKASADEASSAQAARHNAENCGLNDQGTSLKKDTPNVPSPMKETPLTPAKLTTEKTPESSNTDDSTQFLRVYLARLDISVDLAEPELYDQFIDLAVKGLSNNIEDMELEWTEDKAIVETDITNLTVDMKLFPVAKDSIFQRAMDLYKAQKTERRSSGELDVDKSCTHAGQPDVEPTTLLNEKVEILVDCVKQEQQTPARGEEPVCTGVKILNDGPLQSSVLSIEVGDESEVPLLDVEKMEAYTSVELTSENADKGILPVESIVPGITGSSANKDIITNGDVVNSFDSAPGELLDIAVSSPLISPHDSVKICESESFISGRIHDAPENTH